MPVERHEDEEEEDGPAHAVDLGLGTSRSWRQEPRLLLGLHSNPFDGGVVLEGE